MPKVLRCFSVINLIYGLDDVPELSFFICEMRRLSWMTILQLFLIPGSILIRGKECGWFVVWAPLLSCSVVWGKSLTFVKPLIVYLESKVIAPCRIISRTRNKAYNTAALCLEGGYECAVLTTPALILRTVLAFGICTINISWAGQGTNILPIPR